MLGPLPRMYRVVVVVTAVTICAAGGAWAAFMLPYPILISIGASLGLALGALCAFLLVHQPGGHGPSPSRVDRRPHL